MLKGMKIALVAGASALALGACTAAGERDGAAASASAAAPRGQPVRYSAQDFFATTAFSLAGSGRYAFAPDGRSILISSDQSGVFNAYRLPVAGGAPVAVTNSRDNATFAISYFPNDERVLVTSDRGGNELNHLYVRLGDGRLHDLTPGERLKAQFVGWSGDGRTFFVATNERNPQMFDVYAYDAASYERRLVFRNEGYQPAAVSPDGRYVALVKAHSSANNDLYLAELGSNAAPRLITQHQGNVSHGAYTFTPDSRGLVYGTDEHGEWTQAWTYDIASGRRERLIAADWDVMNVSYSPSGRYRIHALNADASTEVTIIGPNNRRVRLRGIPAGDLGGIRFNRDETQIAFTVASDTSPSDIFIADVRTGQARRLTTALNPRIDERQLVEGRVVRFASFDGVQVPGILYRPREASASNPVPAIVLVHGGPGGQSRRGYSAMVQHLVNNGYAVYAINNRGSSGYGKTFYHMDDRRHGDVDLKDVVASRDFLANMDWVSDRVAVMGGSYGGYITAAALAFHPETFDAGVNIFGVTNWVRTLNSIPAWWGANRVALFDEMGDPATDAERHRAISPLFHANRIRRPLLVVQGANDPRVLQVESDELVAAARRNNVPVEYLLFPDEGHGFLRKENRIRASEAYLTFLNQHLRR
ncbi:MAG TPA: S9 family peptidase [Allosphingosinicella sp.]|jgi:dipeptidyl aminopeptidase/acylaminoacyl peptidase